MKSPVPDPFLSVFRWAAFASLVALLILCLAWELWLAPLRPGGSLLALKAAPLALPLAGIFSGRRYTYQWTSLLVFAYFTEGIVRGWADTGTSRSLALAELLLSVLALSALVAYARVSRPSAARSVAECR